MKKKLEIFNTSSKDFLETMECLVSNDKSIRENAFPTLRDYLKKSYSNNLELFQKISRSLFYFFYNTDKSNYQLSMAKLISSLIYLNEKNKALIPEYELWISTFLSELGKKFNTIDVLRLDKYIMLCDQVISNYLTACLENKKFNSIINLIQNFVEEIKNSDNNYNFSFESNKIKIINRFINILFNKNFEIKNKDDFVKNKENGFINLFRNLLQFYLAIKDKREIEFFNKNIFEDLLNIISINKKENNKLDLINEIKKESELFLEKNKNALNKNKINMVDFFVNKIRDENYKIKEKSENNIIDPVNDYIMNKKYKQKFRKSKTEIIKEKKEKKNLKNKNKNKGEKNIEKNKKSFDDIIDINNIEIQKEIINLDNNNEQNDLEDNDKKIDNKEEDSYHNKNLLNKKIKRNKKEKNENI